MEPSVSEGLDALRASEESGEMTVKGRLMMVAMKGVGRVDSGEVGDGEAILAMDVVTGDV